MDGNGCGDTFDCDNCFLKVAASPNQIQEEKRAEISKLPWFKLAHWTWPGYIWECREPLNPFHTLQPSE